jgi:hypothetical protein
MSILETPHLYLGSREVADLTSKLSDSRERVFVEMLCHRAMFCGDLSELPFVRKPNSPLDLVFLVTLGRDLYRLKPMLLEALLGDPENVNPFLFDKA